MDFFEVLTEKTLEKEQDRVGRSVYLSAGVQRGIAATIEALKEMKVGEPRMARLYPHGIQKGKPVTLVYGGNMCKTFWHIAKSIPGHHGIDGEEVVVMVFRTK